MSPSLIPPHLKGTHEKILEITKDIKPAGQPRSDNEAKSLLFASRTIEGNKLPDQYLVYFLLVDFLNYPDLGKWEKTAWAIPIRYKDRLYSIEHRKFGIGIFSPNYEHAIKMNGTPSKGAEWDAHEIVSIINQAIRVAKPYFQQRAEQAAEWSELNVINRNNSLYDRYTYFRDKFGSLMKEAEDCKGKGNAVKTEYADGTYSLIWTDPAYQLMIEARWNAQTAIDAFFNWTEHLFIHLAILQWKLHTGIEVRELAKADWRYKFQKNLDIRKQDAKLHYDKLVELRNQVRNFIAHWSFGKDGEAFSFHSKAWATPVLLTRAPRHHYALGKNRELDEKNAISDIDNFISFLWSSQLAPAKIYIESWLPLILSLAKDWTYEQLMKSDQEMTEYTNHMTWRFDDAANMDW